MNNPPLLGKRVTAPHLYLGNLSSASSHCAGFKTLLKFTACLIFHSLWIYNHCCLWCKKVWNQKVDIGSFLRSNPQIISSLVPAAEQSWGSLQNFLRSNNNTFVRVLGAFIKSSAGRLRCGAGAQMATPQAAMSYTRPEILKQKVINSQNKHNTEFIDGAVAPGCSWLFP